MASLVTVVLIVIGMFFFSKNLHKFVNIQYVAVTRNINSILYVCNRFHCPIYRQIHGLLTRMLTLIGSL